ncbi:pyruvate formate-lyase acivating protein [Candidatus Desulfofervidus auxilii]|uniref:Pyruvate formate-lyase acivating protein n=2 Tax=Desulfofervidus auxilii TaxID=1621989 RepID=A0A7U4QM21_DESA2|nr:pyruvate formate-lyase acivating protein [Candidatus Desulfofervidus auxilii]
MSNFIIFKTKIGSHFCNVSFYVKLMFMNYPTVKKAILQEEIKEGQACCVLCERRCVIKEGKTGVCKTRKNINGCLYTLVYGDISALEARPIEIKPFFHFYPGSKALTFSTWSCNFDCPWCQNWHLSKNAPNPGSACFIEPELMVEIAQQEKTDGLCISFQEPTVLFEYALDVFKLAKKKGLYNTFVSNGYMTLEALKLLKEAGMDAINIDIKGDKQVYKEYLGAREEVIWRNAKAAKEMGMHVEMVHLIVSGLNDELKKIKKIVEKHLKYLGPQTPLHFTRYFPAYNYHKPPTAISILEQAYTLAQKKGVLFPYIGNIPGHHGENTYCPHCYSLLIKRHGWQVVENYLTQNTCPFCGQYIPVVI